MKEDEEAVEEVETEEVAPKRGRGRRSTKAEAPSTPKENAPTPASGRILILLFHVDVF